VKAARKTLRLTDRDITVLRGLLSFIPADRWDGPLMVHAANRTLQERCDGMEERTLRRRLAHLCQIGLITRHQSPNRKRYVVRDEDGATVLAYGFCLMPLRQCLAQVQDMAAHERAEALRLRALKAMLRDAIHHATLDDDTMTTMLRLLRRKASETELTAALEGLPAGNRCEAAENTTPMTDNDRQTVRHIQSSKKENHEEQGQAVANKAALDLDTCLEATPNAAAFSNNRPQTWPEVERLAQSLAPAIGIDPILWHRAKARLGAAGASMAILGLVEAYPRIKAPARYLAVLLTQTRIDLARMFRSLTGWARFPAGNQATA
jgi:replication initiation protein RepC